MNMLHAILLTSLFLLIGVATAAAQAQPSTGRIDDEAAIGALGETMQDGWNALDGTAFAAPFAENADYVVINGMHIQGRQQIDKAHQQIFDTVYRDTHLEIETQRVRFLRPDVAVAHLVALLKLKATGQENRAMITLVLTKNDGAWQIDAFQNTRIEDPPDAE